MAYEKTEWKDRKVENPRTFSVRDNEDGTITLLEVPGEITEVGTPVNAENMNKIENGIVQNESDISKRKFIGFEKDEYIQINGDTTITLKDSDEIKTLNVVSGAPSGTTITMDISQLTFPQVWFSVYFKILPYQKVFSLKVSGLTSGAKVLWINGNAADFSDGKSHWITLRVNSNKNYGLWSDNGTEG